MTCPKCGHQMSDDVETCPECGADVAADRGGSAAEAGELDLVPDEAVGGDAAPAEALPAMSPSATTMPEPGPGTET